MKGKDMKIKLAPLVPALEKMGVYISKYEGRRSLVHLHRERGGTDSLSCCPFREVLLRVSASIRLVLERPEDLPLIMAKRAQFLNPSPTLAITDCIYQAALSGDREFLGWCKQIRQEDIDDKF